MAELGIDRVDVFGYSLGAGIAMHILTNERRAIRRAVLASVACDPTGLHPQILDPPPARPDRPSAGEIQRRFEEEYRRLAPDPGNWPVLATKVAGMSWPSISTATLEAIDAPILLVLGDNDIVTAEHAVALFRLLGGGVLGDLDPMPASQLAILPGTSHIGMTERAEMLMTMIPPFLDAP